MAQRPVELRFKNYKVLSSLVVGHKVSGNRERMVIFLTPPNDPIRIDGGDNVSAAILEIQRAFEPADVGWAEVER